MSASSLQAQRGKERAGGGGCCWGMRFACGRPKHTLAHLRDPEEEAAVKPSSGRPKKVAQKPERYELHNQDETHLETNSHLCRVWHRVGTQPVLPAVGTNRRVTVFGSVEARSGGGGMRRAEQRLLLALPRGARPTTPKDGEGGVLGVGQQSLPQVLRHSRCSLNAPRGGTESLVFMRHRGIAA